MQKSIVVFRTAGLGDFILCIPALVYIRKLYKSYNIILLTIFSTNPNVSNAVSAYSGGPTSAPWIELVLPKLIDEYYVLPDTSSPSVKNCKNFFKSFRIERSILLLDPCSPYLGRIKKVILMLWLTGFKPVIGWRSKGSLKSNVELLHQKNLLRHHVYGPLSFINEIKPRSVQPKVKFAVTLPANAYDSMRIKCPIIFESVRYIVIVLGSIQPHKIWPLDKYAELMNLLHDKFSDLEFVIAGTKSDSILAAELSSKINFTYINLVGMTSIVESGVLFSKSCLVIGNDGGAVHLADAVGANVISIIPGIEYPNSIEPWNNTSNAIRHAKLDCSPCYSFSKCPLGTNHCMVDIDVSEVFEKCAKLL